MFFGIFVEPIEPFSPESFEKLWCRCTKTGEEIDRASDADTEKCSCLIFEDICHDFFLSFVTMCCDYDREYRNSFVIIRDDNITLNSWIPRFNNGLYLLLRCSFEDIPRIVSCHNRINNSDANMIFGCESENVGRKTRTSNSFSVLFGKFR